MLTTIHFRTTSRSGLCVYMHALAAATLWISLLSELPACAQQLLLAEGALSGPASSSGPAAPSVPHATDPLALIPLDPSSGDLYEPVVANPAPPPPVNWVGLTKDSLNFLVIMHGFRCGTEPGTRDAFGVNSFFPGYIHAVENLHGWNDGDPFYVNYIGHPMQGAVSSAIWANNDRAYKYVYFGSDKDYWKEKLRGGAFAYFYSVQFEIGPMSEASIGNLQSYYPAFGFVDHVVTPTVGTGWAIGEDVIDRYLVRRIEDDTDNRVLKLLARGVLNPARSFANVLGGRYPWYRSNRPPVSSAYSSAYYRPNPVPKKASPPPGVAPFEFTATPVVKTYLGSSSLGSCVGGGAGVALRLAKDWQIATDVNGCKMTNLPVNTSGDSLTYVVGPRWSSQISPRWAMHTQVLVGGTKVTQELIDPEKKKEWQTLADQLAEKGVDLWPPPYSHFAKSWDTNAFAVVTGGGVEVKFSNALALRTSLDYSHTWNRDINGINYRSSLQLSSGLVLKMGTW